MCGLLSFALGSYLSSRIRMPYPERTVDAFGLMVEFVTCFLTNDAKKVVWFGYLHLFLPEMRGQVRSLAIVWIQPGLTSLACRQSATTCPTFVWALRPSRIQIIQITKLESSLFVCGSS